MSRSTPRRALYATSCVFSVALLVQATTASATDGSDRRGGATTASAPAPIDPPIVSSTDGPAGAPGSPRAGDLPRQEGSAGPSGAAAVAPSAGARITGIDVSNFQHPSGAGINWNSVASSGKRFVFVKATEGPVGCTSGSPYTNPYFSSDYNGAGNAGMWRGAYHFARPRLPLTTAADDARRFIAVAGVPSGGRDLPPVLDLEQACGMSKANVVAWAKAWLDQVKVLTGYRAIVYTGYYFWHDYTGDDHSIAGLGYPLWIARYASQAEPLMGGWSAWTLWQFTSSGVIPGISGNVDTDYFNGDEAALGYFVAQSRGESPSLDLTHNTDGRAELVYVDGAGNLYQRWESGGWSGGWLRQTGVRRAAIDRNSDGRLEVFAIRNDGYLIHSWQTCAGCGWSGWYSMGNGFTGAALDTAHNADGRMELVSRNGYGVIVHTWQTCPICGWTGWYSMGIAGTGSVTIGENADGRMEMFAINPNVIHAWQDAPNGGWSWWYGLADAGETSAGISTSRAKDGRLLATWRGANSASAFTVRQVQPNGFSGWGQVVAMPWANVSSGPTLSTDGDVTWAAACSGQNTIVTASLDNTTGGWQAAGPSSSTACRGTNVLADRPGPLVLVLGDGVQGARPGSPAAPL